MRNIGVPILLSTLLLSPLGGQIVKNEKILISTSVIGPYGYFNNEDDINITLTNKLNYLRTIDFKYQYFIDGDLKGGKTLLNKNINGNDTLDLSISSPYSFINKDKKVTYKFSIYEYDELNNLIGGEFPYFEKIDLYLNALDSPYTYTDNSFSYEKNVMKKNSYTLSFSSILENSITSNSSIVDLSNIYFSYSDSDFSFSEAYLVLDNAFYLNFPNEFKIPISLVNNDGTLKVQIDASLYLDEKTYEVFSEYSEGLKEVKDLYIPKNKEKELEGKPFHFHIKGFGKSKIDISFTSYIELGKRVIGSCNNSDVCIVGGTR